MAQEFQDLTGQLIRRVITLVDEIEEKLVALVAISGERLGGMAKTNGLDIEAEGPALPKNRSDIVNGQDEVDDLLASLGF